MRHSHPITSHTIAYGLQNEKSPRTIDLGMNQVSASGVNDGTGHDDEEESERCVESERHGQAEDEAPCGLALVVARRDQHDYAQRTCGVRYLRAHHALC